MYDQHVRQAIYVMLSSRCEVNKEEGAELDILKDGADADKTSNISVVGKAYQIPLMLICSRLLVYTKAFESI